MTEFKELMALSKGFKIFFAVLSVVAVAGLLGAFALQSWAKDKIQHGEFVLNGTDKSWQERLESGFAYDSRLYFERADFLLRSKVIAYIDIRDISWVSPIDKNAVSELKSRNRHIKFSTSQNLSEFNGQKLGVVEYKMDFSPLLKTIVKYYLIILFMVYFGFILYKVLGIDIDKIVKFLSQNSLPQALWQGYKAIDPLYRHTFWIVFIACNVVFGFDTAQFLWGRESWGATFGGAMGTWMVEQGRYTQNAIAVYLTQDLVLPILNNILAFAALSVASILLCVYLNITRKVWIWVLVGCVLTLSPFTLARMYFTYQVVGLFIAVAIGILGFVLAKKAGKYNINSTQNGGGGGGDFCHSLNAQKSQNSLDILPNLNKPYHKPYALCLLSILCIHWGIASYQPFIDTALILLCGGIIAIIIDNRGDLKLSFYKSRFLIISVAFAAISYKIVLDILKKLDIVQNDYNNQMIALSDLPERIIFAIKLSFEHLFAYNVAFMPEFIAILFGVFVAILLILLFGSKLRKSAKFSILIVLCGMIIASQTHIILSKNLSINIITEFYSLPFLRVLVIALVFKLVAQVARTQTLWQNLCFVLPCVIIWACVVQSLNAQKIQKLSMEKDFRFINRVIDRIEQLDEFSYDKQYCGIMFGTVKTPSDFLGSNLFPRWDMQGVFGYTMQKDIFKVCGFYPTFNDEFTEKQRVKALISRLHKAGILDKLEPFPHKNSVVVFEDIIVFVASKGNLDEIRASVKAQDNGVAR